MCNQYVTNSLKKENIVYVPMAADIIHPGHLNIINKATDLGKVVVGLFTDEAISTYKKAPTMNYEMRKIVVLGLKGVSEVIPQISRDYEPNLRMLKPRYMVHGTDWRNGPLSKVRQKAIDIMKEWGGEVIEPEYTKDVSSSQIKQSLFITSEQKRRIFLSQLNYKEKMFGVSVYDKITAKLADEIMVHTEDNIIKEFSSLWVDYREVNEHYRVVSCDRIHLGVENYISVLDRLNEETGKPVIADDIVGLSMNEYSYLLRSFQKIGLVGVVLYQEDIEIIERKMEKFTNNLIYDDFKLLLYIDEFSDRLFELMDKYREVIAGVIFYSEKEVMKNKHRLNLPIIYFVDEGNTIKEYQYKVYRNCVYHKIKKSTNLYLAELLNGF